MALTSIYLVFFSNYTFLFNLTSVKIECTLQVLENMAPNAKENPAISNHALAVQMYGNAVSLDNCESRPRKMTLLYVSIQPIIMRLFKCGDDILMYLFFLKKMKDK